MPPSRLLRCLSHLYPPGIRRRHADELLADLADAWRERPDVWARLRLVGSLGADMIRSWSVTLRGRGRLTGSDVRFDVVLALRRMRSTPATTAGVLLMLIVGIASAATTFALSDPFLSRPLPYLDDDRLVLVDIDELSLSRTAAGEPAGGLQLSDWQARADLFEGLAGFVRGQPIRAEVGGRAVTLETLEISANLFDVLGVSVPRGTTPQIYDDEVWIMPRAAAGRLASATLTMGSRLRGTSLDVRGVLPSHFLVPGPPPRTQADVLIELPPGPVVIRESGTTRTLRLVGRVRDGIDAPQVEAALTAAAAGRFQVVVTPLAPAMKAGHRPLARGALGAGLLVLIVCAANSLGMALTRGLYRVPQVATMQVLGAGPVRIVRLLAAEGVWLAAVAMVGIAFSLPWLMGAVRSILPPTFAVLGDPVVSGRVWLFALAGCTGAGAAWTVGSIVAWHRSVARLRDRQFTDGRVVRAVRFALASGQVAVTLVFFTGAALLGRSYLTLVTQETGMDRDTRAISVSYGPETPVATVRSLLDRTLIELRRSRGVESAALVVGQMADDAHVTGLVVLGRPVPVEQLWVSPDYFEVTGMSFVQGRSLTAADAGGRGVVVNQILVGRLLGGDVSLGETSLAVGGVPMPIVGVVNDAMRRALDEPPRPAVFRPFDQPPFLARVTYLVRGEAAPSELEAAVWRVAPDAEVLDGATLRTRLARTIQDRSFAALVIAIFAGATVTVTICGLLGVVGYVAARRTREVGIRLALGARVADVVWLVLRDAAMAIVAGTGIGLTVAVWLSGSLESLVYGISATDLPTLVAAAALIIVIALGAAAIPARRAARLSPTVALRED